jgi:hypothetical protein
MMPLEDSPSTELYEKGIPAKLPDPQGRRKKFLVTVGVLAGILFIIALMIFFRSQTASILLGKGAIAGRVVDQSGNPVVAQAMVEGQVDNVSITVDGAFNLERVPAGHQILVIGYQGQGIEVPVQVIAGEVVKVGDIKVQATALPPQ